MGAINQVFVDLIRSIHIYSIRILSFNEFSPRSKTKSLIIAPHPDDEVIGCGGLITRLVAEGSAPHIIIMTGGEGSHKGCCSTASEDIINARRVLTRKALAILGVPMSNIHELNFPDGGIDLNHNEKAKLKALIDELSPDSVFVPHWGEGWPDHVKTAEIVKNIVPAETDVWEYCVWMWYYNVWRGLDWKNATVLKMTSYEHRLKLQAIDTYIKPLAPCGNPWSGVLPEVFVRANQWDKELYFKTR